MGRRGPNELVYDFCYLPIDFKNRCNLGYAFVNFVDAAATAECFTAFNAKRWNDFNSKKVGACESRVPPNMKQKVGTMLCEVLFFSQVRIVGAGASSRGVSSQEF